MSCFILCILMLTCTNKNIIKASINSNANTLAVYNWVLNKDKENPDEIKNVLKIIGDVDFNKLNDMVKKNNKEEYFKRSFYKAFYEYNSHNAETIENIFKARTKATYKNEFDDLLFDLYKKDSIKPIIDKVTALNSAYKNEFNMIMESENEAYLVYEWGTTSKHENNEETKKVLDIIGKVDFNKINNLEKLMSNNVNYNFKSYPNHNFKTIKNIFDAKTFGGTTELFDCNIYLLYNKSDIRPIIDKVVNSNPKYKKRFNSIEKKYKSLNQKWNYPNIFLGFFIMIGGIFALIIKIDSNKYLSSLDLKNKFIKDKSLFIKYKKIKLKSSGIIMISMGIISLLLSNSEKFTVITYFLGFSILLISNNYFEYICDKYLSDKK